MPATSEENYLFDLYRRYVGEPEDRTDVYLGFGLFLGGIGLAVVALVAFLWSVTLERPSATYWSVAQLAYAFGMASLPVTMLGIVVLLPSERRVQITSAVGVAVTLAAVVGFVLSYPADWNFHGDNYTAHVVAVYAVGLAGITASTGAALIAHYLTRDRIPEVEAQEDDETEITDEEIRRDIDEALADVELSWGGVEKREGNRLRFTDEEFDTSGLDVDAETTRSSGVDSQVAGLKGLKGGERKTTTSPSTVDDQTAKLTELRKQRERQDAEPDEGVLASVKRRLGQLAERFGGGQ